jgi:REP element-mobilizing transposase RayT
VTRRCTQRQFLLRPSDTTNRILGYCLALAVHRYPVHLHAYCFLSNHVHLVLTDPSGLLPEFMRYLNEMIARAINASLGRWESLWGPRSYNSTCLETPDTIVDKVAYTLANPVVARLVRRARRWPGVWSDPRHVDAGPRYFVRPDGFFRRKGPTPESVRLQLVRPPGFESTADFVTRVEDELRRREDAAVADAHRRGDSFVGERAILSQRPTDSPASVEPRRGLSPRIAASDRSSRIEAIQRLKEFLASYREAWRAFRAGVANVLFPAGTYLLRVRHGVRCAPAFAPS